MNNTVLLVLDMQRGLFQKGIYKEKELLENINYLIDKQRADNNPIIFARQTNTSFLKENSDGWQLHQELKVDNEDIILNKTHSSIFKEKKFCDKLKELSVKRIIVTGLVSHGCVKAAAIDGNKSGYDVIVINDGHSNFSKDAEQIIDKVNSELEEEGIEVCQKTGANLFR